MNGFLWRNLKDAILLYDNMGKVMEKNPFLPRRTRNRQQTSSHKPSRILAQKGQKEVGAISSGERGQTTTTVCCMSAARMYVWPMFIYKWEKMKPGVDTNVPVSSVYHLFSDWLRRFAGIIKVSKKDPALLILDNHSSHYNLGALPLHTSHMLQPLNLSY